MSSTGRSAPSAAEAPVVVRAAGACVWRPLGDGEVEVLLVHRPKYDDWSLPKGKLDPGEHPLTAAVREVEEETGHHVVLGRPLLLQRYRADGSPKAVRYWAARADDAAPDWPGTDEIDRVQWLPTWRAASVLTHPRDVDVVRALVAGPPTTTPVVLLRHAEAVPRKSWEGDDEARPLTEDGERVAAELPALLRAYRPERVVSSPALRCTATVEPYAEATGLRLETDDRVTERSCADDPAGAAEALRELVEAGRAAVLSTHRRVLPPLRGSLEALALDGVDVPGGGLSTGGFVVAHTSRGCVVAVEQHAQVEA